MTTDASAAVIPQTLVDTATALPLRQDDPVSLLFICKTLGVLALLLLAVYLVLRWYASRQGRLPAGHVTPALQCVQTLRLSARTKTYLLDVEGARVLVTETASGTTMLRLVAATPAPESTQ